MRLRATLLAGLCLLLPGPSQAARTEGSATVGPMAPPTRPAPRESVRLVAGTELEVELVGPLSSATSHLGDKFALRLVAPIASGGVDVVAAGAVGEGEVIDAAPAGMAGRAGKLILSARRIDMNGYPARIRGLTLMAAGHSRVGLASGVLLIPRVGLAAVLIRGGEVEIPAGAQYTVKLAEDVDLPSENSKPSKDDVK